MAKDIRVVKSNKVNKRVFYQGQINGLPILVSGFTLQIIPGEIEQQMTNAYVGVPKGHPLYGADYKDVSIQLTYSGNLNRNDEYWYFGTDNNYEGQGPEEVNEAKQIIEEIARKISKSGVNSWTPDNLVSENMAKEIRVVKSNDFGLASGMQPRSISIFEWLNVIERIEALEDKVGIQRQNYDEDAENNEEEI